MADERPTFRHPPRKHGLIGPFSGRQLGLAALAVVVAAVVLIAVTTPLGSTGLQPGVIDPRATPFVISSPTQGLAPGSLAPELEALLYARVDELSGIDVRRGVQVVGLDDDGDAVTVHGEGVDIEPDGNGGLRTRPAGEVPAVRARYVVGCDGAVWRIGG